jgi:hypothetical protein
MCYQVIVVDGAVITAIDIHQEIPPVSDFQYKTMH